MWLIKYIIKSLRTRLGRVVRKFENIKQYFCLLFALCFLYSPLLHASGKAQGETCTDQAQCSQGLECGVRPYSEHKDFGNITNSQIIDLMEENRSVTTIAAHDLSSPNDFSNLTTRDDVFKIWSWYRNKTQEDFEFMGPNKSYWDLMGDCGGNQTCETDQKSAKGYILTNIFNYLKRHFSNSLDNNPLKGTCSKNSQCVSMNCTNGSCQEPDTICSCISPGSKADPDKGAACCQYGAPGEITHYANPSNDYKCGAKFIPRVPYVDYNVEVKGNSCKIQYNHSSDWSTSYPDSDFSKYVSHKFLIL